MERFKPRSARAESEPAAEPNQLEGFLKSNPASTGVLAGIVTMSGQIAAQFDVPDFGCRIVALAFALLLAHYQVWIAQRRPLRESLFLIPIVAVILFTAGWGANGLVYEALTKEPKDAAANTVSHRPQASLGEWLADQIIPAAYAQSGDGKGGGNKHDNGGWKQW